ncbi:hypothetical protein EHQ94_07055 [Leptospira meyeri]|uniref:hypothetical protein n=1 Tax=Leptospira meyeri TaxID=29508 RepID=UPI0010846FE9|nr:hypothetical protein [Leptospira meyeri]TGM68661.1 hypothetical protein EHQ93_00070 [Leptospira meyeri]TGM70600.1 hypothetical protein EHQ94_07055 [Leptospira meyeri]
MIFTLKSHIRDLVNRANVQIEKSTIPIFKESEKKLPFQYGTGVLLEIENRYFLISAAHTILDESPKIYLPFGDEVKHVGGNIVGTKLPASGFRNDDRIDLASLELQDSLIDDLKKYFTFIKIENTGLFLSPKEKYIYIITGFPHNKTKIIRNESIKSSSFSYFNSNLLNNNEKYIKTKTKFHSHLLMEFDKKQIINSEDVQIKTPKLDGMSGCGFWCIPNLLPNNLNELPLLLAGIFIEHHESENVLVGTRIHIILELLRQEYNLNLPESKFTRLNIIPE